VVSRASPGSPGFKSPLGIGAKLTLGFCSLAAVTLLVVVLALLAGRNATNDISVIESVRGPASLASSKAQASLLRMQLHVRGYLVLGDPADAEQFVAARQEFERNLVALKSAVAALPDPNAARSIDQVSALYERWVTLPRQLFDLHDNPLRNQPALRIARVQVQPLRVQIMDQTDMLIRTSRMHDPAQREVLADLLGFQTSFDAMTTNLMAYGASGEPNFKRGYGSHLATNASIWNSLFKHEADLPADLRARLDVIAQQRSEIARLAQQILTLRSDDHAYEDLYLYRTQFTPQAEALSAVLGQVTSLHQAQLQTGLVRARQSLAAARLQTTTGAAAAIAFGVGLALMFRRTIVAPVRRLTRVAERIAGGDLLARAAVESHDELGVLGTSLNTMTQRLTETIAHLETIFAQAQRAKEDAEAASRAKSAFLASMSHELRTPLNAVLGYAQLLRREEGLSPSVLRGLNIIQTSGEHLLTLINGVLDLARIEAGKVVLQPDPVDVSRLVSDVANIVRVNAEQKGLVFAVTAHDLPLAVRVDEKCLRQVLLNLLGNAVKFTQHGRVDLRFEALPMDGATARLRFEVSDTGIGIKDSELATIFQPFEQAADVQRRFGGTGLGLAISWQLVHLMGSDIHVESTFGRGSRFWFDLALPLSADDAHAKPTLPARTHVGYHGPRRRILVVDDVAGNRRMLADLLTPLGFEVHEADDGQVALQQAVATRPHLILMDSVMPVMDGPQAIRHLRRTDGLESVPVISVSASGCAADQRDCLAVGANAFLSKPIDVDALLTEMGRLLALTWLSVPPVSTESDEPRQPEPLVAPPAHELTVLYRMAKTGNMRAIRAQADRLEELGEPYRPLAQTLRRLADRFQSKAILDMVAKLQAGIAA